MALIHADERNLEQYFRPEAQEKQIIKSKTSYFVNDKGSVTMLRSQRATGISRKHGKRWYRWEETGGSCVYKTKSGSIAGFTKTGKRFHGFIPFHEYRRDEKFQELVHANIGPLRFEEIYPLAEHYGIASQEDLPVGIRGAFKAEEHKQFAIALFGKTRYRKPLNRALNQANPSAISVAHDFRGLVPIDWIIDFLRINQRGENMEFLRMGIPSIREYLMRIEPRSYRHLLQTPLTRNDAYGLADIERQRRWRQYEPHGRVKTWTELHDMLLPPIRWEERTMRIPLEKPSKIPLTDLGKKLQGKKVGTLKVVIPTKPAQLTEWGDTMSNCIGGYVWDVGRENSTKVLGACYEGEKLIANFEISNNRLRQLLGKANKQIPKEHREKMEAFFKKNGVEVDNNYWGASAL